MKSFYKTLLAIYLLALLWLVLFKFSFEFSSVLLDHQTRSLNILPFVGSSQKSFNEILYNIVVFIPFGLLLSVCFRRMSFWWKLACVFFFSLTVEILQFILAIGVTDITDIITNTLGGFIGLGLYKVAGKRLNTEKLDLCIAIAFIVLLILFLLLRFFVFRVRY